MCIKKVSLLFDLGLIELKTMRTVIQSTLSKWTLSKPDTSLKRTANLVPAELHLYLCNWTLSKADTSLSRTADTLFKNFGSKPLKTETIL